MKSFKKYLTEHEIPDSFETDAEALVIVQDVTDILTSPALLEFMGKRGLAEELEDFSNIWKEIVDVVKA